MRQGSSTSSHRGRAACAGVEIAVELSTTRGIATAHRIDIACSPSRKVANYFKPTELAKLDRRCSS
jgi:hypothetical protein